MLLIWLAVQGELVQAVQGIGFEAEALGKAEASGSDVLTLAVDGMTCSSCSSAVEGALRELVGVRSAAVNLLAGRAEVRSTKFPRCTSVNTYNERDLE
jgi:Cu+-exporting ATPase